MEPEKRHTITFQLSTSLLAEIDAWIEVKNRTREKKLRRGSAAREMVHQTFLRDAQL